MGLPNPVRDESEGTYRGGEEMTPVNGLPRRPLRVKTSYELTCEVNAKVNKNIRMK